MTWISSSDAAALEGVAPRVFRRRSNLTTRRCRRGRNARAIEIAVESLSLAAQARYYAEHPEAAGGRTSNHSSEEFDQATESQRERAIARLEAVLSWRNAQNARKAQERKLEVDRRWLRGYRLEHPSFNVSVSSVKRWSAAYDESGIDGLVDGNDGRARRGQRAIPPRAVRFFEAEYLDENCKTVSKAIRETRMWAAEEGLELPSNHAFYRYAKSLDPLRVAASRDQADKTSAFLPYVERAYDLPALHTIQSDHHQVDVGIRCADAECRQVHFPWLTCWIDVRSRKVISWTLAIDHPNSRRILDCFRQAVNQYGLPSVCYVDNGKDYRAALGKRFWRDRQTGAPLMPDEPDAFFQNLLLTLGVTARFATPYKAQAKLVEKWFRKMIEQWWRGFVSYRGPLGKRTERAQREHVQVDGLPTLAELATEIDAGVAIHNDEPSRARGLDGRTPNEVFHAERAERRDPERLGWALAFWRREQRMVQRNGVTVDHLTYWLESTDVHMSLFGRRVSVLIDPEDVRTVLILDERGKYACDATLQGLSPQTADGAEITADHVRRVRDREKEIRRELREGDYRRSLEYQRYQARRPEILAKLAAEAKANDVALEQAAAVGATTSIVPAYSRVAKDRELTRASRENPSGLTPEERELASSVPAVTEELLDRHIERQRNARLYAVGPIEPIDPAEEAEVETQLARARRQRALETGICEVRGCRVPLTVEVDQEDTALCGPHWFELFGAEIEDAETRESVRQLLCGVVPQS